MDHTIQCTSTKWDKSDSVLEMGRLLSEQSENEGDKWECRVTNLPKTQSLMTYCQIRDFEHKCYETDNGVISESKDSDSVEECTRRIVKTSPEVSTTNDGQNEKFPIDLTLSDDDCPSY